MNLLPLHWPMARSVPAGSRPARDRPAQPAAWWGAFAAGTLLVAVLWSYWTTLLALAERWTADPQYSHGFLVPVFAGAVLWSRRGWLAKATWEPGLVGLPLLLAGMALRLLAIRRDLNGLDALSLLPTLTGLVWLVGGRGVLRWSSPALLFLVFMIPLPFFADMALAQPLRRLATIMSTYTLQLFGYPALAEGNVIFIGEVKLGVVEACSGLGMLMTFFALATALALVVTAALVDRLVLIASAIPIAVLTNVARIAGTGMAYHDLGSAAVQDLMHDLSGWLMMPVGLALLWLELRFLQKLFVYRQAPAVIGPLVLGQKAQA